jgi:hypothetical protein
MLVVLAAIPFKSELMLEKKSRLAPEITLEVATKDVELLVDSRRDSGVPLVKESPWKSQSKKV